MKKLLFQFDTDQHPSSFDAVVAYDGGADHVIGHANLTPDNVGALKLSLHRACIARLFEDNKQVLDAENIFALAKTMA